MASIGIALSGGGHRAALFSLGVLAYLVDAGKNREVTSIASVSGGSLTNGVLAQAGNYGTMSSEQFTQVASELRATLVDKGTLWASPLTKVYGLGLLVLLVAPIAVWFVPWSGWLRLLLLVAFLLALGLYAQLRGVICGLAEVRRAWPR
jgi:patatin-like phospholipase